MLPAASIRAAAEAFDQDGGARGLGEVEARLASRFGPPARILASIDPLIVETTVDVRAAERRLMRSLVKDTDGRPATSSGRSRCRFRAAWRESGSRPIK